MRQDTSGCVYNYTGRRCYAAHLRLLRYSSKSTLSKLVTTLDSGICARWCVWGLMCVCAHVCMFWWIAWVLYPGVYPGIRSWSANAGLLAAAAECQQMWIVKRSVWFISCPSTCTKHSCCLAHRAK